MAVFAEKGETYTIFSGVGPRGNYCWPSVAVLPGGDLIAVCSGRRFAHLCPFGRLSAAYSNDGGKTWSKPAGLLDTYTDERDAGVLAAPDGVYVTTFNNTLAAQRKFSEIMQWDGRSQRYIDAQLEMYGEYFDIPKPDDVIFTGWFSGGEVFRSGCTFTRGRGKIFYFQPGHEEYPIYYMPQIQKIIKNAVKWCAPLKQERETLDCREIKVSPEARRHGEGEKG